MVYCVYVIGCHSVPPSLGDHAVLQQHNHPADDAGDVAQQGFLAAHKETKRFDFEWKVGDLQSENFTLQEMIDNFLSTTGAF